jgi:hypothetical protein
MLLLFLFGTPEERIFAYLLTIFNIALNIFRLFIYYLFDNHHFFFGYKNKILLNY